MQFMYYFVKLIRKIIGFPACRNVKKGEGSKVDSFSLLNNVKMGKYSYVGEHSSVLYAEIGSFCSISNYCAIGGGSHPMDWVSTSPVFYQSKSILHKNFSANKYDAFQLTTIGNDVWIGSHALVKSGVKVADGAVIAMGAVVTKDVGPYEIWGGNPAVFIRKRFEDSIIKDLLASKWWCWEVKDISKAANSFHDLESWRGKNCV